MAVKIAIDLDGVLCNVVKRFAKMLNLPVDHEPKDWNYSGEVPLAEIKRVLKEFETHPGMWRSLEPYKENKEALAKFLRTRNEVEVYYITARAGVDVLSETAIWLHIRGLLTARTTVIPIQPNHSKADVIEAIGCEYSVDDRDLNVLTAAAIPRHHAYLLDRPWNRRMKCKNRVNTLQEFLEIIP